MKFSKANTCITCSGILLFAWLVSCRQTPGPIARETPLIADTTAVEWVNKKLEFNRFLDSIQYGTDTTEAIVLEKLTIIRKKFAGDTHPDLPRLLREAEGFGFNHINYDTEEKNENCCRNKSLPISVRRNCFWRLLHDIVHQGEYKRAIRLYAEMRPVFDSVSAHNWYDTGMDSLRRYLVIQDSINKLPLPSDSLHYLQAQAYRTVVMTAFYCHEGCGGCDHSIIMDQLTSLLKLYPESALVDNAAFELIEYQYQYSDGMEEEVRTEEKKALNMFIKKYRGTDAASLAENRLEEIEQILSYYRQQ
jgi:hypothetical protein